MSLLRINDEAPDFTPDTTHAPIGAPSAARARATTARPDSSVRTLVPTQHNTLSPEPLAPPRSPHTGLHPRPKASDDPSLASNTGNNRFAYQQTTSEHTRIVN